jgi:hypothetical protein
MLAMRSQLDRGETALLRHVLRGHWLLMFQFAHLKYFTPIRRDPQATTTLLIAFQFDSVTLRIS